MSRGCQHCPQGQPTKVSTRDSPDLYLTETELIHPGRADHGDADEHAVAHQDHVERYA